jgi:hypothetical protein
MRKMVVVARYNENITWLNEINCEYVIYNKGNDNIDHNYKKLENIGREPHTYITYILENYNNLPDVVCFVQGNPFDHCNNIVSKINNFNSDIEVLSDNIYDYDSQLYIDDVCNILFNSSKRPKFGAGAQYILNKNYILSKSYDWWEKAMDLFNSENVFSTNELRDLHLPHIYERLWIEIWSYKDV